MKQGLKIVTIGGGSSYTPELVEGFIKRYEQLPVKELWLVDIEEGKEKLEIVSKLAQRMVEKAGVPMKVIPTLNRREALKDADFVTTQMRVGLLEARILDERIPLSLGMIGQETNGAGGMFKAFRTIPVILDIVKDIQELCPDAWLINFTNPAGIVTEAIYRHTSFKKAIGLCNCPINMIHNTAYLMKVDPAKVTMEIQGSNHHMFATDVFVDGESVFEEVLNRYIEHHENASMANIEAIEYSEDFMRGLNAIPSPYHNYYFFTQEQLAKQLADYEKGKVRGEVVKQVEAELFELYQDVNLDVKPKQLEQRGGALYSDAACDLITSLYNDTGDIQYINIPNNGTLLGLDDDAVIEAACVIKSSGPEPIPLGEIKLPLVANIQMIKAFERLVVDAAVTGNRSLAIAALNINPLCPSDRLANQVFDQLLAAHKSYLPQFA